MSSIGSDTTWVCSLAALGPEGFEEFVGPAGLARHDSVGLGWVWV